MGHRLDNTEQGGILVCGVHCTVAAAATIHGLMVQAARTHDFLFVDLRLVEQADVTFLQLLAALWQAMAGQGKSVRLMGQPAPAVLAEAQRCGLPMEFLNPPSSREAA